MRRFAAYAILVVTFLLPATAKAQLFLEEGKVVLAVAGGDRINKSITISNPTKETVNAKIYWEDFDYLPPYDGTKEFFPVGVKPDSASKWLVFSPQEVSLPPFGKAKIDYSVNVPENIDKGYYGVLFFEKSDGPAGSKGSVGVTIVTRVGALFFIEPKDAVKTASLEKISAQGSKITGEFINKSPVTLLPRMVYYIMEEGGLVKDRGELKKIYVPSQAAATWEMSLPEDLAAGQYTVVLNADLGEENVVTKEFGITKSASGVTVSAP